MVFLFSTRAAGVCASGFMNTAKLKNTFVKPTKRFSERFRTILDRNLDLTGNQGRGWKDCLRSYGGVLFSRGGRHSTKKCC